MAGENWDFLETLTTDKHSETISSLSCSDDEDHHILDCNGGNICLEYNHVGKLFFDSVHEVFYETNKEQSFYKVFKSAARKYPAIQSRLIDKIYFKDAIKLMKPVKVMLHRLEELPICRNNLKNLLATRTLKLPGRNINLKKQSLSMEYSSENENIFLKRMEVEDFKSSKKYAEENYEDKCKDYFDDATLEYVRHNLLQLSSIEGMFSGGPPSAITFHSTVIAKRIDEKGQVNVLLHWNPEDMVPDSWVAENDMPSHLEKTIPVSKLPPEALQLPSMEAISTSGILPRPGKRKRK